MTENVTLGLSGGGNRIFPLDEGSQEGGAEGAGQRYVYVELEPGANFEAVRAAILADPMFAGEATQVFQVEHLTEVESEAGQGVVLERQETAAAGVHAS